MSIHLREGFSNETLERVLEDLAVRFVVNCPNEDLSSIERVLFLIEEAQWFYQDFARAMNPLLPPLNMKKFTTKLLERCPLIWKWGNPRDALLQFGKYKSLIPVRGCALFTPRMDKMLLVQGIESPSWAFPRGKISKDETDVECAVRELKEETGYDASSLIDEDEYVERTIRAKNYKIFFIRGIPEETVFKPVARNEIRDIKWWEVKSLLNKKNRDNKKFFLVPNMIKPITAFIHRVKGTDTDEELKIKATAQLKKILGIGEAIEPQQETDPGRALLTMLQNASKNAQSAAPDTTTNAQTSFSAPYPTAASISPLPAGLLSQLPQLPIAAGYPPMQPMATMGPTPFQFHLPYFNPFFPQSMALPPQFPLPPFLQPFPVTPSAPISGPTTASASASADQQPAYQPQTSQAPAASSFAKPTIRSQESNSKVLLALLKAPDTTESQEPPKIPDSHPENYVKRTKNEIANPSFLRNLFPKRTNSPETVSSSKKIQILKRPNSTPSSIDVTTPANSPNTGSSFQNSAQSMLDKPVKLLRREHKPSSKGTAQLLGILNGTKARGKIVPPMNSNPDPQHLNVIKHTSSHRSASPLPKVINEKPETENNEDPSAYLLGILNKPKSSEAAPPPAFVAAVPSNGAELLSIINNPHQSTDLPKEAQQDQQEQRTQRPLKPIAHSNGKSLLEILQKPNTPIAKSSTPAQSGAAASLLSVLKRGSQTADKTKPQSASETETQIRPESAPVETNSESQNLLKMLKRPQTHPIIETLQNDAEDVAEFSDFEDFDDLDDGLEVNNFLHNKQIKTYKANGTPSSCSPIIPKKPPVFDKDAKGRRYWLIKTEPVNRKDPKSGKDVKFSIEDLAKVDAEPWTGVRNYEARNNLLNMAKGDICLVYHSNCKNPGIVGIAIVASKQAKPDLLQFDTSSGYFDAKSTKENPRWWCPDISFAGILRRKVSLSELKLNPLFTEITSKR
ncbi:hypothetical protein FOA43_001478 [Brettanomyces nanus]|uniref:Nudix hydrolase domain-containing protein n=1 Tax=Eeniella nana TaxID=13502 RepID=A0A875S4H6_EENNA|nr:uncharacterized protein FOA43_001478 [Brettanomyces nanus]QPG74154.1 hypothetical protein FOA43_001478 [Brettanomyces nanus]